MAASLGSIPETWPENVLTSIVSRKSHCVRKIIARPIFFILFRNYLWGRMDFLRICAIFCRYWTCSFSGRNDQAIGPRSSAIFTEIRKIILKFVIRNQELSTVTVLNLSSKWQSSGFSSFILLNISVCGIFRASRISL